MSAFGGKADIVLASQDSAATDYDSTAFHMGTAVKCFCPHLGGLVIVTLVTHRIAIASVHLRHARFGFICVSVAHAAMSGAVMILPIVTPQNTFTLLATRLLRAMIRPKDGAGATSTK
jgi:hypothetical protein